MTKMDACSSVQILKEKLQSLGQLETNIFSWLTRLSKEQAVNLLQLRLQFTFTTEGLMPSNQISFTNPANF